MFKSIVLYCCEGDMPESAAALAEAMAPHVFQPLGAAQQGTGGWIPPRAEHGALVEAMEAARYVSPMQSNGARTVYTVAAS